MKIKILLLINHIIFLYGIITQFSFFWASITVIGLMLIGKVGGEIYMHRYVSHNSFSTSKTKEIIILCLSIFNCMGSPLEWAGIHRKHHAYSDKENDPHGNQHWLNIWSTFWKPFIIEIKYVKDIIRNKQIMFVHNNYLKIIFVTYFILSIIDWRFLAFGICGASVLSFHQSGIVNVITHRWGYRNFDTPDRSTNNSLVNLLSIGSGLHNNHHAKPNSYRNNILPHEWDLPGWIIEKWLIQKI
jgi:stearoyl-CoA desaturase (delta-9 desaturase)